MSQSDWLFIYGTLLPGLKLEQEMAGAECLGHAEVRGHLYDIGCYPGLVDGEGWVSGEIHRVSPAHLHRLDAMEEVVADDRSASLYWRERIKVETGAHAGESVWVYRYNKAVEGLKLIPGGDYRRYLLGRE